jgi:uncharacterized glyoxalase superfamily protein PhnB
LLIDWERAGPGRSFEIRVPDVIEAQSFYKNVLGARETSRYESAEGEPLRLGLAVGKVEFTISSEEGEAQGRPLLSLLAAGLGVPYVAIMLRVEGLDRIAYEAEKNGASVSAPDESGDIVIFTDPFGNHWVLKRQEHPLPYNSKTRH